MKYIVAIVIAVFVSGCTTDPHMTHRASLHDEALNGNRVDLLTLFRVDNRQITINNSKGVEL